MLCDRQCDLALLLFTCLCDRHSDIRTSIATVYMLCDSDLILALLLVSCCVTDILTYTLVLLLFICFVKDNVT